MKTILAIIGALTLLASPKIQAATDAPRTFLNAVSAYRQGDYQKAQADFTKLVSSGIQNGKLYYNLGNASLRNGDLGHAILYYEKARRLMPSDPDLGFNLQYARSRTRDKAAAPGLAWLKVLLFWNDLVGPRVLQWLALAANVLFWTLAGFGLFRDSTLRKGLAIVTLAVTLLFSATCFGRFYDESSHPKAVVLADQIAVRSGLGDKATQLFVLHAGTLVTIDRGLNGYYRVTFAPDKFGWVPREAVGVI